MKANDGRGMKAKGLRTRCDRSEMMVMDLKHQTLENAAYIM